MPGPKGGVIMVDGDFKMAQECELENTLCAETAIHKEELKEPEKDMKKGEMPSRKEATLKTKDTFRASKNTKKARLNKDDPSKEVTIGNGLSKK